MHQTVQYTSVKPYHLFLYPGLGLEKSGYQPLRNKVRVAVVATTADTVFSNKTLRPTRLTLILIIPINRAESKKRCSLLISV